MTCICVLGMHRSGTSCLTGIMQGLGVELGEVFTASTHNKKGNRENDRIVRLNESLLTNSGGSWWEPVEVSTWSLEQAAERDAIVSELSDRGAEYWGFKDTRTIFTLPFWLEAVPEPSFIGTFRHPQRVALSLYKRDKTRFAFTWELWHKYNSRLLTLAQQNAFALTDFDLEDEAYMEDVLRKLISLGLDPLLVAQARTFFDSSLRNQAGSDINNVNLPAEVEQLYSALQAYSAS